MTTPTYTAEQVKDAIEKFTAGKFQKFGTIIDIAKFIWDVVNHIMDTFNDQNLTHQQKEDIAVGISRCVVSELQSKNLITKELSEKMLNIINSADGVLDVLFNIYNVVATKNIVEVLCGLFGFKCCGGSNKPQEAPVQKSLKVEVIDNEVKVEEVETPKVDEIKDDLDIKLDSDMPPLESVSE
jgi:hypothetical protein